MYFYYLEFCYFRPKNQVVNINYYWSNCPVNKTEQKRRHTLLSEITFKIGFRLEYLEL